MGEVGPPTCLVFLSGLGWQVASMLVDRGLSAVESHAGGGFALLTSV